jgi:hypothetical protein
MVTINGMINIIGTVICIGVLMTPVIIAAILGTRARLREAKQIKQNITLGVYAKWDKTKNNRLRIMILSQTLLLFGLIIWIVTGFLEPSEIFSVFRLFIFAFIFITMFILGFAINKFIVKG